VCPPDFCAEKLRAYNSCSFHRKNGENRVLDGLPISRIFVGLASSRPCVFALKSDRPIPATTLLSTTLTFEARSPLGGNLVTAGPCHGASSKKFNAALQVWQIYRKGAKDVRGKGSGTIVPRFILGTSQRPKTKVVRLPLVFFGAFASPRRLFRPVGVGLWVFLCASYPGRRPSLTRGLPGLYYRRAVGARRFELITRRTS